MTSPTRLWTTTAALLAGAACGGDGAARVDAGPTPDAFAGDVAGELVVLQGGGFGHLLAPPVVAGEFPDSAVAGWYTEIAREGSCRVEHYEPGFCDPVCTGVCVDPGVCHPYPTYRGAGTITVTGLLAPVSIDEPFDGRYHTFGGLPDPLFEVGASVGVSASGGQVPAFAASAVAPAALSIAAFDGSGTAVLTDGADLTLTWSGADPSTRVRVFANSAGAFHGVPPAYKLECDAPDTGSFTIPRAIIEALPVMGTGCQKMHDCAKFSVMRYRADIATTSAGAVRLLVGSGTNYLVVHK